MSQQQFQPGSIGWIDLTVEKAESLREFYAAVAGWTFEPVDVGGYNDFNCKVSGRTEPVAGLCHRKGVNSDVPAGWVIYIVVEDMDAAIHAVSLLGGRVLAGPKGEKGQGRTCFIRDPSGAAAALYEPPS